MKTRFYLLLVLLFSSIISMNAQCPPGSITFSSQQEINQFQINYPGCTVINGNLTVSGADITNVAGIGMLTSVTGDYVFENNAILTNPAGFNTPFTIGGNLRFENNGFLTQTTNFYGYLTSIGGELQVIGNDSLFYLSGFQTTTSIGGIHIENNPVLPSFASFGDLTFSGNVRITNNDALTGLNGLYGTTSIGGNLFVNENDLLNTLFGLNFVTSVGGDFNITGNASLPYFFGLNALATIGGGLTVQANGALTTFAGLVALNYIGGVFDIEYNNSLNNFIGMSSLTSLSGELRIANNPSINSMSGLNNLTSLGTLYINNNDALTSLQGLDAVISIGELHIEGNDFLGSLFGPYLLTNVATLRIYSNPGLFTLNGLNSVNTIETLYIIGNAGLQNLNGLNGLTSLGNLFLGNNPALNSLGGMPFVTSIPGNLDIFNNTSLPNLVGLYSITSVGNFRLVDNDAMTHPSGMFMLTSITGNFLVQGNEDLIDFSGLNALAYISGDMNVNNNAAMTGLLGLSNLASIGGDIIVQNNPVINLNSILSNLTAIGGNISISGNNILSSLFSFNHVTSIGYGINISGNNSLTNLQGIGNIDYTTIQYLNVQSCPMLFDCNVTSICDYLANGGYGGGIGLNAMGCNSEAEVETACFCPPSGMTFTSQEQIVAFATSYPNCTTLPGDLVINGPNITNLNGLSGLAAVNGYLNIFNCPLLTSLNGLNGLLSINGFLNVANCDLLTSLNGLENISYTSVSHLYLSGSALLSTCEIPNICSYVRQNLPYTISGNANGCNTSEEIQNNCNCTTNRLTNPGFDSPVQPFFGDNLTGLFTFNGWTMTGNTFNVIRTNGSYYPAGPDNAQDGTQYIDVAYSTGTVYQDFNINGPSTPVYFGGYFSSRTGQPWTASVDIFSMPSNTLVSTSSTYNITWADVETWRFVYGYATLPAGDYRYVANIHDDGNFDAAFVFAGCSKCTWNGSSGDWSDDSKWSCGHVPGATDDIIINSGLVTVPAGFDALGKTLDVALSGQLLVAPTGTLFIEN